MKERILETAKMLAIGVWDSPPIELLTASVLVPVTIGVSVWLMQWIGPILTIAGIVVGLTFGLTAIVKSAYWLFFENFGEGTDEH